MFNTITHHGFRVNVTYVLGRPGLLQFSTRIRSVLFGNNSKFCHKNLITKLDHAVSLEYWLLDVDKDIFYYDNLLNIFF